LTHVSYGWRGNKIKSDVLALGLYGQEENREEPMATSTTTGARETTSLIGSDKVEGTAVYGPDREKIGSIERVMIDKLSGKVAYAVLSFGGFLGMGEDYYPVPWSTLDYDTNLGGYRVNFTREQLDRAPKYAESQGWNWSRENDRRVYDYYRAQPYWE
jgi:PRC-barrel domain